MGIGLVAKPSLLMLFKVTVSRFMAFFRWVINGGAAGYYESGLNRILSGF